VVAMVDLPRSIRLMLLAVYKLSQYRIAATGTKPQSSRSHNQTRTLSMTVLLSGTYVAVNNTYHRGEEKLVCAAPQDTAQDSQPLG